MAKRAQLPGLEDVRRAAHRLAGLARLTPVLRSASLDRAVGAGLAFKCEVLQRTGAFKVRGAGNAVLSLDPATARRGVATHSSGNHGAALAFAARERGIPCTVVMPEDSVKFKVDNVRRYGAEVVFCEPAQGERERKLERVVADSGAEVIPPYDDPRIIAGQGTCALELMAQAPGLDDIVVPVGGAGLIGGTAIVAKTLNPGIRVWGAEPSGTDDAARSLAAGRRVTEQSGRTLCDGLRAVISELTFQGLRAHVDGVITVDDEDTVNAMRSIWRELKLTVEPSSAIALAAILTEKERFRGRRVALILTGGNVDIDRLPWSG